MKAFKNMSAKLLPIVISLLLSPTTIIYDKNFNVVEYWVEKDQDKGGMIKLYNKDWTRKGYIRKEGDKYTIYVRTGDGRDILRDWRSTVKVLCIPQNSRAEYIWPFVDHLQNIVFDQTVGNTREVAIYTV